MIDFINSLLPTLPSSLEWVYGVCYIITYAIFLFLILFPFLALIFALKFKK